MKTKLKSILNARDAVQRLAKQSLPVAVSYRVTKLVNAMNVELAIYEKERVKLCEKYGSLNETGEKYIIREGDGFSEEFNTLLDFDIELDVQKIILPVSLLITAADLLLLSDFVEIEGAEDD